MRVSILSRASALAQRQARQVAAALAEAHPDLDITLQARSAAGDRDTVTPLARFADKGAFTSDLSRQLLTGEADLVVHSWKDLPIESGIDTVVGATLRRADPRDVLLVRPEVLRRSPAILSVLTSSPRRAWTLTRSLPPLLPWTVDAVVTRDVRGNITTRLRKLVHGDADALVVAKAALDRLLAPDALDPDSTVEIRTLLKQTRWMVLPLREFPTAPAQGALAIEVARANHALRDRLTAVQDADTWIEVVRERALLAERGGGCHDAFGATARIRSYGTVLSTRGSEGDRDVQTWKLDRDRPAVPRAPADRLWPPPHQPWSASRLTLRPPQPQADGYWVSRADAWPADWVAGPETLVWVAGARTWRRLAGRGVWVNGSAEGLGDEERAEVDLLAGRPVRWLRLTHTDAAPSAETLATYLVRRRLPQNLESCTHFFWTSGVEFTRALQTKAWLADRWHGSGPGATARAIKAVLGESDRAGVWLDYDHWLSEVSL